MEKNEHLVSIVVPIYNVEPYLQACIDSLCCQTYKNLEIILVDDGSTDHSGEICDQAAEKDSRIHVTHKVNGGVSDARNKGLDQAAGDFISFIDPDDVYAPYFVECLLNSILETEADVCIGNFQRFSEQICFPEKFAGKAEMQTGKEAIRHLIGRDHIKYTVVHNKLYRGELMKNIRFVRGKIHEDEEFMYRLLYRAQKVAVLQDLVYGYRFRPESITTATYKEARLSILEIAKTRAEFFRQHGENELYINFLWVYAMLLLQHYPRVIKNLQKPDWARKMKQEYRKTAGELLRSPFLSGKRKCMTAAFVLFPGLYAPLMDMRENSIKSVRK